MRRVSPKRNALTGMRKWESRKIDPLFADAIFYVRLVRSSAIRE
jgi:hypothetical protein